MSITTTEPAALMTEFAARAAAGDADGLLALYAPDATFQPGDGVLLRGHGEIGPAIRELAGLRPQIRYEREPDVVVVGDVALVANRWTMEATAPDGSAVREGGVSADVLRRGPDGAWAILIDQPRGEPVGA